jgi:acyl-CoA synthetase (AMP-forming)/AMP-acid ligase II/acetyl-CoA acetyltransferase
MSEIPLEIGGIGRHPPPWRKWRSLLLEAGDLSMANFTDRYAEVYGDRSVLVLDPPLESSYFSGGAISYRELNRLVRRAANLLRSLGVRRGDRVALATLNRIELAFVEFGAQRIGAIPVPLNYMLTRDEIRELVERSGARVMVTDCAVFDRNIRERFHLPSIDHWVVAGERVPDGLPSFDALMSEADEGGDPVPMGRDDAALIFFTAGTTGSPKGALLTSGALVSSFRRYAVLAALLPTPRRRLALLVMPLAHTGGHQNLLVQMALATPSLVMARFDPQRVLDHIERYRVSMFSGIPAMYRMLLEAGAADRDLSSIRLWGGGADAFPSDLVTRFREFTARPLGPLQRKALFMTGYGMAETSGQVSLSPPFAAGDACVGYFLPGVRWRLVDEAGRQVPRGEVGELWLKTRSAMREYWNDPAATASVLEDGWLRTGDMMRVGRWGMKYFVSREKEMIKVGGYSVFPAEIEKVLGTHPEVHRCVVVGLPHRTKGELPVAAVVPEPGSRLTEEMLLEWAEDRIAAYRCPRRIVFTSEIPQNFSMKPLRRHVREELIKRGIRVEARSERTPGVAGAASRPENRCAIAGIGLSEFGQIWGTSNIGFTLQACKRAIEDAGIDKSEVDGCLVSMPAVMGEQHGWATRIAALLGIEPRLASTMDMGGATPIGMIQTASCYIRAGMARAVLCTFGMQNNPQGVIPQMMGSEFALPYGDVGALPFMAHVARRQMHEYGFTSEQYGAIAVTFREHACLNPLAQMQKPMTLEDHQNSRYVAEPLHLFDCCVVTDGGGAVLVTSLERARDLRQKPAVITGAGQEHGPEMILPAPRSDDRLSGKRAADAAFEMAGMTREDVDVCFLYDGFTPLVMHELMAFGFCPVGEAGRFAASGAMKLGGELPTNTNGGLLSEGHLYGMGHVAEAARQIRGQAGARQLPKVEVVFANGFGGAPHEAPPTVSYSTLILTPDA